MAKVEVYIPDIDRLRACQVKLIAAKSALRRLASTEAFTTALDLKHSKPEAIAAELHARMQLAVETIEALDA